jgi:hypothetical protein
MKAISPYRCPALVTGWAVAMALVVSGCGHINATADSSTEAPVIERPASHKPAKPTSDSVAPSRCSPDLPACRTTEGRIVYVERVDPDGDGDAHFVVVDSQGITLPGLTAIDVRKGLRPDPLPGAGDLISAAGPVQTGSYGQSQIHALELHVAGR